MPLLSTNLSAGYKGKPVLRDLTLDIGPGEIVGVVGQSGSGKSTLALSILGLLGYRGGAATGEVRFRGADLLSMTEGQLRRIRGKEIGLILQTPSSALNPSLRIGSQLREVWRAHSSRSYSHNLPEIGDLLAGLDLPIDSSFLEKRPAQISVGQAQRVLVAIAVMHGPALLIADEPTSALDPITKGDTLRLLKRLNQERNAAILYISHDLLSVAAFCEKAAILHEGRIIESGSVEEVLLDPVHPYTKALVESIPRSVLRDCAGRL